MSKIKKDMDDDFEDFDLKQDFNINDEDLKYLLRTHQSANNKKLKYHLKKLDNGIEKIEDGLMDVLYIVDELIERCEEGDLFDQECGEALEKLCVLTEFTKKLEEEFNALKSFKDVL